MGQEQGCRHDRTVGGADGKRWGRKAAASATGHDEIRKGWRTSEYVELAAAIFGPFEPRTRFLSRDVPTTEFPLLQSQRNHLRNKLFRAAAIRSDSVRMQTQYKP
jgi:hypothetical protein